MNPLNRCLQCIAQPNLYSVEQCVALVFGVACLGIDGWAVVYTHRFFVGAGVPATRATHSFGLVALSLEALLALSIIFLLGFAFSARPPDSE